MNINILPITGHMTEAEYDRERARLRETYGDNSTEAGAKRDQALAKLFHRSGWTQEELAKKEGKGQQRIGQSLRFGRFLNFTTTVVNPENPPFVLPAKLTERKFREYWERTDKTESKETLRFRQVIKLMQEAPVTVPRRNQIGKAIREQFADGRWHKLSTIVDKTGLDKAHVEDTLEGMYKHSYYGTKAEMKETRTGPQYRLFKTERTIATSELRTKLHPIITGLKAEGSKHAATMSVQTVAALAVLLERQLIEWEEGIDPSVKRPEELAAIVAGVREDEDE